MQQVKTRMKKVVAVLMAFALCFCFTPMTSWAAGASSGETFTIEKVDGAPQQYVKVNGEYRSIFCMQYDNLWPVSDDPAYHNSATKYTEATADQMYLTPPQMETIRKVLYAGYPYDAVGVMEPIYENWGSEHGAYLAATLTQNVVWYFMSTWGVPGNSHYNASELEIEDMPGVAEAHQALIAYANDPSKKINELPAGFTPQLTGDTSFTQHHHGWMSGKVKISNPAGYKLRYSITLPDGIVPVDAEGNEIYSDWDFITGELVGHYVYGDEEFYLKAADEKKFDGATISFTALASAPTDVKQYMTNDTGRGDKGDGQGYVQHPYQNMLSVGIASVELKGSAKLSGQVSISVSKKWDDAEDQDRVRPSSAKIKLLADGVDTGKFLNLTAHDAEVSDHSVWKGVFENLPKEVNGKLVKYTVEEVVTDELASKGYSSVPEVAGSAESGFTVTNTRTPATVDVSGKKTWYGEGESPDKRPASVTVRLHADVAGVFDTAPVQVVTPNEQGVWTYSFTDLPKYHQGEEIVYSVSEDAPTDSEGKPVQSDYHPHVSGFNIENHYAPLKTAVQVEKVWDDNDDQDGIRPDNVTVYLVMDDVVQQDKTLTLGKKVVDGSYVWSGEFLNLERYVLGADGEPAHDKDGNLIPHVYSVSEADVSEYTFSLSGDASNGFEIKNTHAPAVTSVKVTKSWDDADNQDGDRPEEIAVKLFANGEHVGTCTLSASNRWQYVFDNLPAKDNGKSIVYTVEEDAVEDYTSKLEGDAATGFVFTNSHEPKMVAVKGEKFWEDNFNEHGHRDHPITLTLKNGAGDELKTIKVEADADGHWKFDFGEWPAFNNGEKVTYHVVEEPMDHFATVYDHESFDLVNVHIPAHTAVAVQKEWDDNSNADGVRPASVTVELMENGKKTGDVLELNEANGWKGSFDELPLFFNGEKAVYTVEEVDVPAGYVSKVSGDAGEGFVITNTRDKSKDDPDKPLDPVEPTDPNSSNGSSDATISSQTGDTASNAVPGLIALVIASAATLVFARRRMLKS